MAKHAIRAKYISLHPVCLCIWCIFDWKSYKKWPFDNLQAIEDCCFSNKKRCSNIIPKKTVKLRDLKLWISEMCCMSPRIIVFPLWNYTPRIPSSKKNFYMKIRTCPRFICHYGFIIILYSKIDQQNKFIGSEDNEMITESMKDETNEKYPFQKLIISVSLSFHWFDYHYYYYGGSHVLMLSLVAAIFAIIHICILLLKKEFFFSVFSYPYLLW